MISVLEFRGTVHQDLSLAPRAREVQALVTVDVHGDPDVEEDALGAGAAEIRLRLWTPVGATIRFVRQTAPTRVDLTEHRVDSGPLTGDYPIRSWTTGSRDYHLCVDIEPGEVGEEKLACRMSLVRVGAGGLERAPQQNFQHTEPDGSVSRFTSARVRALWTDDLVSSTVADQIDDPDTGTFELAGTSAQEKTSLDVESTRTTLLGRGERMSS